MPFEHRMLRRKGRSAAIIGSALIIFVLGLSQYVQAKVSNKEVGEVVTDMCLR